VTTQTARSYGPSALGGGGRRFLELTMTLARTEFKLRYFGSILGYAWSLMRPLLFFGVLFVFFTKVLRIGAGVAHYGSYLLMGIVFWNFLAEATGNAVNCLVTREGMLRKVRFPRMVVPLSVSLTATFNLAMNFIAVIVFALVNGVTPTMRWLEMLPITLGFVVLATGLGMLLSALYVRFRDMAPIWEVGLQIWFYTSPIMFPISSIDRRFGHGLEHLAMTNPVATLLTQAGHAFVGHDPMHFPSAITAGGVLSVAIALTIIPGIFALGWWFFTREAPRVAEEL
jgi:ABC-2 type transport system permease protein